MTVATPGPTYSLSAAPSVCRCAAESHGEDYGEVLTRRDKRRYYCPDCGNVLTVYTKRAPELVPVHYRWGGTAAVKCGASQRSEELEPAP